MSKSDEQIAMLHEMAMKYPQPCVICGEDPTGHAIWAVGDSMAKAVGVPEGKKRLMVYHTCDEHAPSTTEKAMAIETALLHLIRENGIKFFKKS